MTQQPSQNKQIIAKLDEVIASVSVANNKITRIETKIEMQPHIDAEQHKAIQEQFKGHDKRLSKLESIATWIVLTILGFVIVEVLKLI